MSTVVQAPFVAGVAAIYMSHNGKTKPQRIQDIFQATARPIADTPGSSGFNTAAQQGAGLIDAFAA